jgi:DNA-binding transcriptional LysR family regulator
VKLTESGEALLPEALKLLASSSSLLERIRRINTGEAGVLSIGFTSSTIICGLPAIIQKHKKLYPHVEFTLKERSPADQLEELLNGSLDIGFIREPLPVTGIEAKPVFKEKFVAVLASTHPLAKAEKLKLKDLEQEPFVLFPQPIAPILYDKVREIFSRANFYPNIVQEAFEWQTIVNLVEANLGVSICPSSFRKMKIGQIKYIPLTDVKTETAVSACINSSNPSKLIKPFLALTEENIF